MNVDMKVLESLTKFIKVAGDEKLSWDVWSRASQSFTVDEMAAFKRVITVIQVFIDKIPNNNFSLL